MSHEVLKFLCYLSCGSVGAVIGSMCKSRRPELSRLVVIPEKNGETVKYLDPGFLAAIPASAVLAAWIDGNAIHAIAYGLVVGYVGPGALVIIIDPIVRRLGLSPDTIGAKSATVDVAHNGGN